MSDATSHAAALTPEPSLTEIWEEHARWLKTVLFARLRDPLALDDVLQETALAFTHAENKRSLGNTPQPTAWGPWLYRVAIRQAILYRRRAGRREQLARRFAEALPASASTERTAADPLTWLMAAERQQQVQLALARLSKRDMEILLLKHNERWSYQQIAEHLGTSTTAVESRLHRARGKLRSELFALQISEAHS
jgi:RNA polymerase sigma factor (sigma-70 family)